jgi:hypothetical protein
MSYTMRLAAALILGLVAAGLNWMYVARQVKPPKFVSVDADFRRGEQIERDKLKAVPVPGRLDQLKMTFIPWEDRDLLFDITALRDYQQGDLVLQRDIVAPNLAPVYDSLGPFEVIAVDQNFTGDVSAGAVGRGTGGSNVTIAVRKPYDPDTLRLLEILDLQSARSFAMIESSTAPPARIVGIEVYPAGTDARRASEGDQLDLKPDEVAMFVSLQNIENVPRVLLVGQRIGFIVPSDLKYATAGGDGSSGASSGSSG